MKTVMIVVSTQCYENYAWREDGTLGTGAEAYWKAKGGSEFKIVGVPADMDVDRVVELARSQIEVANEAFTESIIGYGVQPNDYLSWFEQSQLEYDGRIDHPEPTIQYADLVNNLIAKECV